LGNRTTPAIGGAVGFERIIETMKAQEIKLPVKPMRKVFIVHVGELAKKKSLRLIEDLRVAGIPISESLGKESIKAQLKVADKQKNTLALIFGQKEIYEESVIIRDLRTGLQETVFLAKLVPEIQKRLKEKIPDNS
jgi:histidyl-tRNA synthetase